MANSTVGLFVSRVAAATTAFAYNMDEMINGDATIVDVAGPWGEPTHGSIVVKNTFISFVIDEDQSAPSRRSTSSPPSVGRKAVSQLGFSTDAIPFGKQLSYIGQTSDDETDGTAPATPQSNSTGVDMEFWDSSDESVTSFREEYQGLDFHPELDASTQPRTRLNSEAKEWAPRCEVAFLSPAPLPAHMEFMEVVVAGQAALQMHANHVDTEITEHQGEVTISLRAEFKNLQEQELGLAYAKANLASAAETSSTIYILGYRRSPFTPHVTKSGFVARLARVVDESNACWDLLTQGFCRRECRCRWQHPASQAVVQIEAVVVE